MECTFQKWMRGTLASLVLSRRRHALPIYFSIQTIGMGETSAMPLAFAS